MYEKKMIVFIGPQGCGKTTQARLLWTEFKSSNLNAHLVSLTQYTVFHHGFINAFKRLCKTCSIKFKFYEDLPPQPFGSFEMFRKLFSLLVAFYFVGFTLALIKQKLLMFCYETLVEHDGYVFKQFADLYHFAYLVGVDRHSIAGRLLKKLARLLLGSQIGRSITIIHLEGEAASLKSRYRKKGTHVEPADYISFQNKAFDRICNSFDGLIDGVIVKIEWNRPIADVHRDLMCCVTKSEYR